MRVVIVPDRRALKGIVSTPPSQETLTGDVMLPFKMHFYSRESGAHFTLRWKSEREYLLGKAFLKELLGDDFQVGADDPDGIPTYYLKNNQLVETIFEFRQSLNKTLGNGRNIIRPAPAAGPPQALKTSLTGHTEKSHARLANAHRYSPCDDPADGEPNHVTDRM